MSYLSTTLSIEADILPNHPSHRWSYRPGISIPPEMEYPHVNIRSENVDMTFIVNNADAAEVLAYALQCAADNLRIRDAKRNVES